jgi:hypothetical protein
MGCFYEARFVIEVAGASFGVFASRFGNAQVMLFDTEQTLFLNVHPNNGQLNGC